MQLLLWGPLFSNSPHWSTKWGAAFTVSMTDRAKADRRLVGVINSRRAPTGIWFVMPWLVRTTDASEYRAAFEGINLDVMDIVQSNGTGFAFPSQMVYLTRDRS